jgi:hypothetical protein
LISEWSQHPSVGVIPSSCNLFHQLNTYQKAALFLILFQRYKGHMSI